ncbi:hypothetical protein KOI35_25635 [Actinoplanes bogorensis]|uniref:Uncharacterized protein n=1 Tax=Paractinoplanes bogorensis TaxID=1610840 RepID=A0ABS5YTW8_9ACTN|nr:hypothetical protein [Actinoplanes bogorensis]MBU2666898.1 hypothetical protein [Actinoplanes bogorensis]
MTELSPRADLHEAPKVTISNGPWTLHLHRDALFVRNDDAAFGSIEKFTFSAAQAPALVAAFVQARRSKVVKRWFVNDGRLPHEELWSYEASAHHTLKRVFHPEYEIAARGDAFLINYWELPSLLHVTATPVMSPAENTLGTFPLRLSDLDGQRLTLPPSFEPEVRGRSVLQCVLEYLDSDSEVSRQPFRTTAGPHRGGWGLHGLVWPDLVRPGMLVTVTWEPVSAQVVVRLTRLRKPVYISDVEYLFVYDPKIVTRDLSSEVERAGPSDRGWILSALRRLGHLFYDGSVTLSESAISSACRSVGMPATRLGRVGTTVERLLREGHIKRVEGSVDRAGQPFCPPVRGQAPVSLLRYSPPVVKAGRRNGAHPDAGGPRAGHWVTGFVRRLPDGAQRSPEQDQLHQEEIRAARVVDRPLAPGYTFVRSHHRHGNN